MNLLRPLERDVTVNGLRLHLLDWGGADRTPWCSCTASPATPTPGTR